MVIWAFQNKLKAEHFNEFLAQKPTTIMEEIMAMTKCYINGEESNVEKKTRDANEKGVSK